MTDVREMVKHYLTEHHFDGLWNEDFECGCELADLAPCEGPALQCQAGHKRPCDCGQGCRFHIGPAVTRTCGNCGLPDADRIREKARCHRLGATLDDEPACDLWIQTDDPQDDEQG